MEADYIVTEHGYRQCVICGDDWHGEGRPMTEAMDCWIGIRQTLRRILKVYRSDMKQRSAATRHERWISNMINMLTNQKEAAYWKIEEARLNLD